tara:strand:+ start:474 stop:1508 length:1035 start_codon:yes stop_codon:yes gene_type:complete
MAYTFNDDINESISQAKADKLARDLQNQKLTQDALMETQRQAMNIQSKQLQHEQVKELTYDQRIEKNIDREWHGNFQGDMKKLQMNFEKYKMDKMNQNDIEKFMLGNLYKKDIIEQGFQNQLSQQDYQVEKTVDLAKKMIPIEIEKANKTWEASIPKLEFLEDKENSRAAFNFLLTEKLADKAHDRLVNSPQYKFETKKAELAGKMLEKSMLTAEERGDYLKDAPTIPSLLTKFGFEDDPSNLAYGNWSEENSAGILATLKEYRGWIEPLAKNDPMGEKFPAVWDYHRSQMAMLDNSLRGAGWGSLMSWFKSMYGQAGKNTQQSNEIMKVIQKILDTKKTQHNQ